MTLDKNKLKELCEKATPGPWGFDLNQHIAPYDDEGEWGLTVVMLPIHISKYRDQTAIKANAAFIAEARTAIPALLAELEAAEQAIEHDRSVIASGVTALKDVLSGRSWLTEGRGPYAWDDDRWHYEFRAADDELLEALKPLEKIAADLSHSPKNPTDVARARVDLEERVRELTKFENTCPCFWCAGRRKH